MVLCSSVLLLCPSVVGLYSFLVVLHLCIYLCLFCVSVVVFHSFLNLKLFCVSLYTFSCQFVVVSVHTCFLFCTCFMSHSTTCAPFTSLYTCFAAFEFGEHCSCLKNMRLSLSPGALPGATAS